MLNKISKKCINCKKIFYIYPYRQSISKYCTKNCMNLNRELTRDEFWKKIDIKIDINLCWEWKKGRDKNGYGKVKYKQKSWRAHKLAYFFNFPEQNTEDNNKLLVRHTCDNPPCCNPNHLLLGTAKDNTLDAIQRKRFKGMPGEKNPRHKLKESEVIFIRNNKKIISGKKLSLLFGIKPSYVYSLWNKHKWTYLNQSFN